MDPLRLQAIHQWLTLAAEDTPTEAVRTTVQESTYGDLESILEVLSASLEQVASHKSRLRVLLQMMAARAVVLASESEAPEPEIVVDPALLARIYDPLLEVDAQCAAHVLQILASQSEAESTETLAELMCNSPPEDWQTAGLALSPLWSAPADRLQLFFDSLGSGFPHPSVLGVILDLANYSVRSALLSDHPWQTRVQDLANLLSSVTAQLEQLQREPSAFGTVEQIQAALANSVALSVSLCDALGTIGDPIAIPKLTHAMSLSHRRIQLEAAAALTRLSDDDGKQRLVALAEDRVARRRAVAYAEELEIEDQIREDYRIPAALAESDLAGWLAEPPQYGLAPTGMELVDSRTQFWPGFEQPVDCFLFRYWYEFPAGMLSNIGLAGPVSHAFGADIANLPVDDIYAAFAGWHVQHEDIFEIPYAAINSAQEREAETLIRALEANDSAVDEPLSLALLLGEISLVAKLRQDDRQLIAVVDTNETVCFPTSDSPTAMTPELVLAIYRGRKLLRTFNP